MPIIAVTNHKGGVGKTTSTLNLAAALQNNGKRVLMVDLDPQANLTIHAGFKNLDALETTLSELLSTQAEGRPLTYSDIRAAVQSRPNGPDLLACNRNLVFAEQALASAGGDPYALREILQPLAGEYDFVIIDCLPSTGGLTDNALAAADFILVPVQAEYLAMQGLVHLIKSTVLIRATSNPNLRILGALITMVDLRTLHSRQIVDAVREVFHNQIRVFDAIIKEDVKLPQSSKAGRTIFEHAPSSGAAVAYQSLANEVLKVLSEDEGYPDLATVAIPEPIERIEEPATNLDLGETTQTPVPVASNQREWLGKRHGLAAANGAVAACPRLGFKNQPDQRALEPHLDHRCFARESPLELSIQGQESLCLSAQHRQCSLYQSYVHTESAPKREEEVQSVSLTRRLFSAFKKVGR